MELSEELLPDSVRELVELIGVQPALTLVEALGGTRLYIPEPSKLRDDHILVRLLGGRLAAEMARHYDGDPLNLPRCVSALRAARNRQIRRERDSGERPALLALRHGLTERQIYSIVAGEQPYEEHQLDIFAD